MPNIVKGLHGAEGLLVGTTQSSATASGIIYTDRRDFYIEPNVVKELWTDVSPFLTMVSNFRTKTGMKDPVFKMFEHRNPWKDQRMTVADTDSLDPTSNSEVTITMPASSSSTFIGLGSSKTDALVGLVVNVHSADGVTGKPSGERKATLLITTVTSDTEIKVKVIGTSTGSAVSLVSGDWLVVVGNAHGEGSESPEPWADDLQVVWGECQIFRTSLRITDTLKQAVLRGEADELLRLRKQKGQEHKIQKERAMIFGKSFIGGNLNQAGTETFADKFKTDADGEPVRTTTGILEALLTYGTSSTTSDDQNIFSINEATYKYSNFVDDMEKVFQYYPEDGVKTMFCGHGMLSYWSKLEQVSGFAKASGWQIRLSDMKRDTLGFNYRMLETPHGLVQLVPTPVLTRSPYNKYGIIVDKSNVMHAIYESPKYRQNIKQDNAPLYQKDEYFSYEGLGIQLIESHKLFKLV